MAVLEAMSMGVPVVTTPVGALQEVVKDGINGRVVDCGDPRRLAEALVELLRDPAAAERISENNLKHVRENFSQEIISQKLFDIFNEAAVS